MITGHGRYAGDVQLTDQAYMAVRRSHLAHARIQRILVEPARVMPGVLGVFTVDDLPMTARQVIDVIPRELAGWSRPVLAAHEIAYAGEALAVVVATNPYLAADAAAAVDVDLEELPAAGTLESAAAPGAARVHTRLPSNIALSGTDGFGEIEGAFGSDSVVVRDRLVLGRVCGSAIEPRAVTAVPEGDGLKVWTSTQAVFVVRNRLAAYLGLRQDQVVVVAEDVGGGFGPKARVYPEEVLVAWAALALRRAVKWTASRTEDSLTSMHGQGTIFELELAADRAGTLRGLRGRFWHDLGAYPSIGAFVPSRIMEHLLCGYRLPAMRIEVNAVLTNATPTGTVRGGGGPAGNFAIERMLDRLAQRLDLDPAEIRRRNLLQPDAMPYEFRFAQAGVSLDGGDYPRLLTEAQGLLQGAHPLQDGRLRGIGLAMGVEHTGSTFRGEPARVRITPDGLVEVFVGSTPQGQSHRTMAATLVAERLGWEFDKITVFAGDTRWLERGGQTAGSRTAVHVGNAVSLAATAARAALLEHASRMAEIDAMDLDVVQGHVIARGAPARRWPAAEMMPPGGIDVTEAWLTTTPSTSPSSCHVVEVAVDPDIGAVEVLRYAIAYDSGREINPFVVEGQLHGGVVHGIGSALFERAEFSNEGELRTPTFLDYLIPSPPDVGFELLLKSCPTDTAENPERIKGVGESGTIPAPAAIAAAVENAIRQLAPEARISQIPIQPSLVVDLIASNRTLAARRTSSVSGDSGGSPSIDRA